MTILLIVGSAIIIALSITAYYFQSKVKKLETQQAEKQLLVKQQEAEKRASMNKSIQVLAHSLIDDQLTRTEGAIRIAALLEFLDVDESVKDDYSAFFQLAEATAHIPILDKWKALTPKEQMGYDKERLGLEETYKDFVLDAAKRIIGQTF